MLGTEANKSTVGQTPKFKDRRSYLRMEILFCGYWPIGLNRRAEITLRQSGIYLALEIISCDCSHNNTATTDKVGSETLSIPVHYHSIVPTNRTQGSWSTGVQQHRVKDTVMISNNWCGACGLYRTRFAKLGKIPHGRPTTG